MENYIEDYIVSLNIETKLATTKLQIMDLFKIEDLRLESKEFKKSILWVIESSLSEIATIEEQIKELSSIIPLDFSVKQHEFIDNVQFTIGIFYYTATCSLNLSANLLQFIVSRCPDINIEFICYPCIEEDI